MPEQTLEQVTNDRDFYFKLCGRLQSELHEERRGNTRPDPVELNRRATIEQVMFDAARGKRPMPDADMLRLWALALGTPEECWTYQIKDAVRRPADVIRNPEHKDSTDGN